MPDLLFKNSEGTYLTIGELNEEDHVAVTVFNHLEGAENIYQEFNLAIEDIKTIQAWLNEQSYRLNVKKKAS